jgi:hypothetical protein
VGSAAPGSTDGSRLSIPTVETNVALPATAEVRQVVDLADKVNGFFQGRQT